MGINPKWLQLVLGFIVTAHTIDTCLGNTGENSVPKCQGATTKCPNISEANGCESFLKAYSCRISALALDTKGQEQNKVYCGREAVSAVVKRGGAAALQCMKEEGVISMRKVITSNKPACQEIKSDCYNIPDDPVSETPAREYLPCFVVDSSMMCLENVTAQSCVDNSTVVQILKFQLHVLAALMYDLSCPLHEPSKAVVEKIVTQPLLPLAHHQLGSLKPNVLALTRNFPACSSSPRTCEPLTSYYSMSDCFAYFAVYGCYLKTLLKEPVCRQDSKTYSTLLALRVIQTGGDLASSCIEATSNAWMKRLVSKDSHQCQTNLKKCLKGFQLQSQDKLCASMKTSAACLGKTLASLCTESDTSVPSMIQMHVEVLGAMLSQFMCDLSGLIWKAPIKGVSCLDGFCNRRTDKSSTGGGHLAARSGILVLLLTSFFCLQ
ncbi:hypothetical protein ACOMHN_047981 [Nucella lapillus]